MSTDINVLALEMRPFVKRSVTTGPGNPAGTTLVDAALVEAANFWNDCWVLLRTGDYAGELRRVTAFAATTLTLDHGVGGQIVAAVQYVMLAALPVTVVAGGGLKADLRQVLGQGADIAPGNELLTDPSDRAARLVGVVYGDLGQLVQDAVNNSLVTLEESPTAVLEGQVVLTGAAQQLPNEPCKSVTLENPIANAVVCVGHDGTVTLANGYQLQPGATFSMNIDNVNRIWIIGTAPQVISYGGVN